MILTQLVKEFLEWVVGFLWKFESELKSISNYLTIRSKEIEFFVRMKSLFLTNENGLDQCNCIRGLPEKPLTLIKQHPRFSKIYPICDGSQIFNTFFELLQIELSFFVQIE